MSTPCPRCGSPAHEPVHEPLADDAETWHCGTYRVPSGNIYPSELCETRQERDSYKRELENLRGER